jgi:hypothetical protein
MFDGQRWDSFNSDKVAELTYAKVQTKEGMMRHFANSSLHQEDKSMQPVIWASANGLSPRESIPWHLFQAAPPRSQQRRRGGAARRNGAGPPARPPLPSDGGSGRSWGSDGAYSSCPSSGSSSGSHTPAEWQQGHRAGNLGACARTLREDAQVWAAQQATTDPLPLAARQWQGGAMLAPLPSASGPSRRPHYTYP